MDPAKLRQLLQWFYLIEHNQVALYQAQATLAHNEVDERMFRKASEIEASHVENIGAALRRRGWTPSTLSPVSLVTGKTSGYLLGLNLSLALRANIALEKVAMHHYESLIAKCGDPELQDVLWSNLLDESLHTEWFKARLAQDVDQFPHT